MGNAVARIYPPNTNTTWVCPAEVFTVDVAVQSPPNPAGAANITGTGFALDNFGKLWAWGAAAAGARGDGTSTGSVSVPTAVVGGLTAQAFVLGGNTNALITSQGAMWTWGINGVGQCGNNAAVTATSAYSSPVLVAGAAQFINAWIFNTSTFALTANGQLWSWGANISGASGNGVAVNGMTSLPTLVLGGLTFSQFGGGSTSTAISVFALTPAGVMYAWGLNNWGQLGTGDQVPRSSPVAVVGGLTFASIVPGAQNGSLATFALTPAGVLYAWGDNSTSQLGVGDQNARSSPTLVLGGLTFKQVISCAAFTLGLTTSGQAYAWGTNTGSAMGIGPIVSVSSPVAVLGGLTFVQLFTDTGSNSYGLTASGQVYAWGLNAAGQCGDGTTTIRSSPVLVLGGLTISTLSAGMGTLGPQTTVFATTPTGLLYAWGYGLTGGLGNGTVLNASSPVLVSGGLSVKTQGSFFKTSYAVTPGQSYAVNVGSVCQFGLNTIGFGAGLTMTLTYQQ